MKGVAFWGVLTFGQASLLMTGTFGLAMRFCTWLTSSTVRPRKSPSL